MKSLRSPGVRARKEQLKKRQNRIMQIVGQVRLYARSVFVSLMTFGIAFMPFATKVMAASPTYQAQVSAAETTLAAGSSQQITLKFKNVGTATWVGSRSQTALYLYGDSSIFGTATWLSNDEPALIAQSKVSPGAMAAATFWVKAPPTAGTYTEKFLLSSAPNQWIKGSVVSVTFHVTGAGSATPAVSSAPATPGATSLSPTDWNAQLQDLGGTSWQMEPEGHIIVSVAFKNKGNRTWANQGGQPMELATSNLRTSVFKDFDWKSATVTALMKETTVQPGGIAHFDLELRSPLAPGKYTESFQLALNGTQFVPGGLVTLPITVTENAATIAQGLSPNTPASASGSGGAYVATLLLSSTKNVSLSGNGKVDLTFGFKNAGTATWNNLSLRTAGVQASLAGSGASVYDSSWYSGVEPVVAQKTTQPGEIGFLAFTLKAPAQKGAYTAKFQLYANDQAIPDSEIDIPITVTADGVIDNPPTAIPSAPSTPSSPTTPPSATSYPPPASVILGQPLPPAFTTLPGVGQPLPAEPMIRVGLFATTDNQMMVTSLSGGFNLQHGGTQVCHFTAGQVVTVSYDRANKVSKASGPNCTSQTTDVFVTVADDRISPLQMTDFSRPVSWLPGANDNTFRGSLELRYTPSTDEVWVINELPIEWYLKGIGETSNSSPMEYQKALLTAARTYAMYHVMHETKHAATSFTVDASLDQVYRGYGAEIRDPAVVSAVDFTRGQIVTYNNALALTPYYSRSDGRTRSWTEVWGGTGEPWLVSVKVPWDAGKTLWGHGVGMSATGALGAAADGWIYDHILNYFYTGTQLTKIYQ